MTTTMPRRELPGALLAATLAACVAGAPTAVERPEVAGGAAPADTATLVHRLQPDAPTAELLAVVGQPIRFENGDSVCHGLFATAAPNACDLGILRPDDVGTVHFEHAGTVLLYCPLHQGERITVQVTEAR